MSRRPRRVVATALAMGLLAVGIWVAPGARAALPPGFQSTNVHQDFELPTSVRFASDGRIFVAEKSGLIKVLDGLTDPTASVVADLSTNVYNYFDRGLLGIELHPNFPSTPYMYALYTYDADIGGTAPKWGTPGVLSDPCPTPPGPNTDGCVASGRLSRLTVSDNQVVGETVLIEDWCQQFPTHSIGTVTFGPDGALYAGGGDAAGYGWVDYGQEGDPLTNPCGDPPGGVNGPMTPPTAEGGSLRSQDVQTTGDPTGLDGTIIRIDPITGAPLPDNPFIGSADAMTQRVIAYGLRNPYRFTFKPGTDDIFVADVGASTYEEIDIIPDANDAVAENFGWPCYEGPGRYQPFDSRNFTICENLYTASPGAVGPFFTYQHNTPLYPGDQCSVEGGVMSAIEFYEGGSYPAQYNGALFFADYTRSCIWVMFPGADGTPNPATVQAFDSAASFPVDLQVGPGGDLYYLDVVRGNLKRIQFFSTNQPPTAEIATTARYGPVPLTVDFDASGSSDPDPGDTLTYEWDLDADGAFDDGTGAQATHTYTEALDYTVRLRVTDPGGASNTTSVLIAAGNTPPTATIDAPAGTLTWRVGEAIALAGQATDSEEALPASAYTWAINMAHCAPACHTHFVQTIQGQTGSFFAPDHEYPAHLEISLTVTDSRGLTDTETVQIFPETVALTLTSAPSGLQLGLNTETAVTPFTRDVIIGSRNSLTAPSPQTLAGQPYAFSSWSDGGIQSHDVTAGETPASYQATFALAPVPIVQEVAIQDARFVPGTAVIPFGRVRWTNTGAANHRVTSTVSGLFDSGVLAPGATFEHQFTGAGLYQYRDAISGFNARLDVPVIVSPTTGSTTTPFTVTYATQAPPPGQSFNIEVRRPAASQFALWRSGQTGTSATFTPDAGAGTYSFRARLITPGGSTGSPTAVSVQVASNAPPTAVINADPTTGTPPMTVNFDGSGSSDPEGGALTYSWDLDGDGTFDDATSAETLWSYTTPGTFTVQLRVTDPGGAQDTESVVITAEGAANGVPTATINDPSSSLTWHVGETISFSGSGSDPEDGNLPASAMSWTVSQRHCPSTCHTHIVDQQSGVSLGSFTAPDHESPSFIDVQLTVTDAGGLTDTAVVTLNPEMVTLTFDSNPAGASLVVNGTAGTAPFTREVIVGSSNSIEAPSPQTIAGGQYDYSSWSDGGAQTHTVTAPATPATYVATFQASAVPIVLDISIEDTRFTPPGPNVSFGRVRWTNIGSQNHTVTATNAATGLFASDVLAPGATFEYHFFAAGQYAYRDTVSGFSAWVNVPVTVTPTSGGVDTQFTVRWASQSPPPGATFSVQYRRQGGQWVSWLTGVTGVSAAWAPDSGPGRYEFRARYITQSGSSEWSLRRVVEVR